MKFRKKKIEKNIFKVEVAENPLRRVQTTSEEQNLKFMQKVNCLLRKYCHAEFHFSSNVFTGGRPIPSFPRPLLLSKWTGNFLLL
jgi:hypothetical protein